LIPDDLWLMATLREELRASARIQAVTRGFRVRTEFQRPHVKALRAALSANGTKLSAIVYLKTVIARGYIGCLVLDRAGRRESMDTLIKRYGGKKMGKASSAKKQRARQARMAQTKGSKFITTTAGDVICVAGPGAVNYALLNTLVLRGRLVLGHVDHLRLRLAGIGAIGGQEVGSDDPDDSNDSDGGDDGNAALTRLFAAHAAARGVQA
jgi:hypothetical protein